MALTCLCNVKFRDAEKARPNFYKNDNPEIVNYKIAYSDGWFAALDEIKEIIEKECGSEAKYRVVTQFCRCWYEEEEEQQQTVINH